MKIVDIIPINPGLAARNADQKVRFRSIDQWTIFKVVTDNGIVGCGDWGYAAFARVYERIQRDGGKRRSWRKRTER